MKPRRTLPALPLLAALFALPQASSLAQAPADFTELSLKELMEVKVTSVSRREQALSDAPASISVITGEDIDNQGLTTLASALRFAPGMQVSRIDAHECAVSARGFNDLYANKLLVLVDGRTIYNQLFSGVFWNQNTVFLSDLDRIEVIRGPGSTQWGANAVNGVVSVSSKNAHDTQGSLLKLVVGDQTNAMVEARQGVKLAPSTALRVYAKYQDEDDYGIDQPGSTTGWKTKLAGFRTDWKGVNGANLTWITEGRETLVGNNSSSPSFQPPYAIILPEDYRVGSYMSLARWAQPVGDEGKLTVQAYFDDSDRDATKFGEDRSISDLDCQFEFTPLPAHQVMLGIGYREERDHLTPTVAYNYSIQSDSTKIFSTFVQDEITLVPEKLKANVGIKFEKGSLFGWQPQPSLRLIYTPTHNQTLWTSVTRAARTPSRSEKDLRMFHTVMPPKTTGGIPTAVFLSGTPGFRTETLDAYELGYRIQPTREFSLDASVFLNHYYHLRDINATPTGVSLRPTPHATIDSFFTNELKGYTYGTEWSARWKPTAAFQVQATYSALAYDLVDKTPILPYPAMATEGSSPKHQASLSTSWAFAKHFALHVFSTYRTRLNSFEIPSYVGVDARLAWAPTDTLEIALTGNDLTDPLHPEFGAYFLSGPVRQIARSYHVSMTLRF